MAAPTSIPRFLLSQSGLIWRGVTGATPRGTRITTRFASSSMTKPGPRVLEKPERFNPPSHGTRLPRKGAMPRHYGGDITKEEAVAQLRKEYPGMMAPTGSLAHRIIYSRWIHLTITLGTLASLVVYVWVSNLRQSPFTEMLPAGSDFFYHPFSSTRMFFEVLKLNGERNSAIVAAKRARHVDDVEKRNLYRKAHGLSQEQGFASMLGLGKAKEQDEQKIEVVAVSEQAAPVSATEGAVAVTGEETAQGPRKKFLGIF
ncbi:hypothetical protein B0T16DRAFT_454554 [Cercophora newfieldiana]|uniref:Uncharacterized protein n=1 Tax=Cercophora newfieldiana TaxID=92897 RepID=A0AA40CUN9_9PEZI|nr:hypothetical protein B0T16DRAFT_454554 [Cercophora newfieldiana]